VSRRLIVNDGERELLLVGTIVVGRDPVCDLSCDDLLLSRRHAEFVAGDHVTVRDLGSRNGTFVNGVRVAEGVLRSRDLVRIGPFQLKYVEDSASLASAAQAVTAEATAFVAVPVGRSLPPESASDDEITRMLPPPIATPSSDDDVTRLIAPPVAARAAARAERSDDEEATRFVAAPAPGPAEPLRPDRAADTPRAPSGFVFGGVAILALLVSLATVSPFAARGRLGDLSPAWIVGWAVAVCLVTYLVGAAIVARMRTTLDRRQ
jgi:predicted component of type VI protein secretion system